jgi:hypothetical protein
MPFKSVRAHLSLVLDNLRAAMNVAASDVGGSSLMKGHGSLGSVGRHHSCEVSRESTLADDRLPPVVTLYRLR